MLANVIHWINLYTVVNAYSTRSVGVFFRRAKFFARESAMLKLQIRGRNEGSQRGGGKGTGREKRKRVFSPYPPLFLSPLHLTWGLLFLLSPIFLCHKIENDGCNETNINKQLFTHALQARMNMEGDLQKKKRKKEKNNKVNKES